MQIMFHDVIDDITRSQNMSNFEIDISPSILELERRSKAQISEILMTTLLVYSTSGLMSDEKKFVSSSKWRPFWKFWNIKHSFNLTSNMKRSSRIMPKNVFFVMITSLVTSQGSLKVSPLYSFMNEIKIFKITWKLSKDIMIKLTVHRYHDIMTAFI